MEVFIWLLCLMIGGSAAFSCEDLDCGNDPFVDFDPLTTRPTEEELISQCPHALEFLDCYFRGAKECLGMTIEEIAEHGDEVGRIYARFYLNVNRLAVEICDEESTLRKNYLESRECIETFFSGDNDVSNNCMERGKTTVIAFLQRRHNVSEDEVGWRELDCLQQPYHWACFAEQLETTCGNEASQTFLTVMAYSKNQQQAECDVENPVDLKQDFLEYLGLEGRISAIYKSIFEIY